MRAFISLPNYVSRENLLSWEFYRTVIEEEYGEKPKGKPQMAYLPYLNLEVPGVILQTFSLNTLRRRPAPRNNASFAVALNCGIGSSSLKALVKAFDRLHIVLGENSLM